MTDTERGQFIAINCVVAILLGSDHRREHLVKTIRDMIDTEVKKTESSGTYAGFDSWLKSFETPVDK